LFHCKVLAETALEAPFKPDIIMSLECAKAASSENHLNLLYKWIAEERFVDIVFFQCCDILLIFIVID
jgi:hypothetical protein